MAKNKKAADREVQYPEVTSEVFSGENALTVEHAKHLLGWEEETETVKFGDDFFLVAPDGKKVRLKNNTKNRPFRKALCEMYVQEHLQRRWRLNGEPVIIGKYGETVDGQHRLTSVIFAEIERLRDLETHGHWKDKWPGPVTMETVVTSGVEEDDETVNTINTGAGRSMGDVLYRSEFFASFPPSKRKLMARSADYAIRFLWHRTGAGMDAFAPRRTHAEALDFLSRHSRLVKYLKHVVEENGEENRIAKFLPLGYASALAYLMGCGKSDHDRYRQGDPPSEKRLDWSLKERAEEFISLLAGGESFKEVRHALGMLGDASTGSAGTLAERTAVLVRAWRVFADPAFKAFQENDPRVNLGSDCYQMKDDVRILVINPTCGGIDLGEPRDSVPVSTDSNDTPEPPETPEQEAEVEEAKAEIRSENVETGEGASKGVNEMMTAARREWPGRLIAFKHRDHYRVWGKDAETVSKVTGAKKDPKLKVDGLQYLRFKPEDFPTVAAALVKAKHHVVIAKVGTSGKPELVDADYDPAKK